MEVIICSDPAAVGEMAAAKVARVCREAGPEAVIGVATGSSPLATYAGLASRVEHGALDLSRAYAFALDEYVGLPKGHPESYAEVIRRTVTEPLQMNPARVNVPDGFTDDLEAGAAAYEAAIKQVGGVDIQILGVGSNGHIGFNEPMSSLGSRTRVKTLTDRTRDDNKRFFDSLDQVPVHCVTQGLGTIMDARNVILVAQGAGKAKAVAALVEGPICSRVPGSVLQLHPSATIVIDREAAADLQYTEYYERTFEQKPDWQRFQDDPC